MLTVGVEGMAAKKEVIGTCLHFTRDGIGETGGIVFSGSAESGMSAKIFACKFRLEETSLQGGCWALIGLDGFSI